MTLGNCTHQHDASPAAMPHLKPAPQRWQRDAPGKYRFDVDTASGEVMAYGISAAKTTDTPGCQFLQYAGNPAYPEKS